jgi:hypothetical protein
VACIWIAAKLEEEYPCGADDLTYISDHCFEREKLIEMEKQVLITLDYRLTFPTALHFLGQLGKGALRAPLNPLFMRVMGMYYSTTHVISLGKSFLVEIFVPALTFYVGEGMDHKAITLARYMLEITAASRPHEWAQTLPSDMAKAAMLLACQIVALPLQPPLVSSPQVENLVNEMRVWVNTPKPKKWDGIREKYARTR